MGEVTTLVRRLLSVDFGSGLPRLTCEHTVVQSQIGGGASCVDGASHIAQAHQVALLGGDWLAQGTSEHAPILEEARKSALRSMVT